MRSGTRLAAVGTAVAITCNALKTGTASGPNRRGHARPAARRQPESPRRQWPAVCRGACPTHGRVDAELDRHRGSRAGWGDRPHRCRPSLRRRSRHQVRDVRGAMIDALRKDAWPRGVRRQRRELDAAREELRRELGHEPSMADLAARVGSDEKRLSRTIVRINTIEATSPLATGEHLDENSLPTVLVPSEPDAPDTAYEKTETRERVRTAIQSLPWRERKVIGLYYYGEVTMKHIGAEIGVNESRVSQLHARAIRRLREALGDMNQQS